MRPCKPCASGEGLGPKRLQIGGIHRRQKSEFVVNVSTVYWPADLPRFSPPNVMRRSITINVLPPISKAMDNTPMKNSSEDKIGGIGYTDHSLANTLSIKLISPVIYMSIYLSDKRKDTLVEVIIVLRNKCGP